MKAAIRRLIRQNKQVILYLLFGVITTVCSLGACYLTLKTGVALGWQDNTGDPAVGLDILGSTVQWFVGVLVAFFTNKKWVFTEATHGKKATWHQLLIFSGSRVLTYFLEVVLNLGCIFLLEAVHFPEPTWHIRNMVLSLNVRIWAKVISSVVIVIANYFISKLLVFRKEEKENEKLSDHV